MATKTVQQGQGVTASGAAANAAVNGNLGTPAAELYAYLCHVYAELVGGGIAPAAGTVQVTIGGVVVSLVYSLNRSATANALLDRLVLTFDPPLRSTTRGTGITVTGNSGDANATLRLDAAGYFAL